MIGSALKNLTLWSISRGLRLPQMKIDRISELCFLQALLKQLDVDCVLDVGANRGQFATELRRTGYSGLILSFEPLKAEFQEMSERFKDDANWRGFPYALGASEESKTIAVPEMSVMTSLLEPVHSAGKCHDETITIKTLDTFLPEALPAYREHRIFLKMDTQGYDVEVFRGAATVLESVVGLQSELSVYALYKGMPHYVEALQVYEDQGFDLYNLSVVSRSPDDALVELNCFMRRRHDGRAA